MMLQKMQHEIMCCTGCGFCKKSCPIYEITGKEVDSGKGKVLLAYGILKGEIKEDESVVKAFQNCALCMRCEQDCPSLIQIDAIIQTARRDMKTMLPSHKKIMDFVTNFGNPFGEKMIKGREGGNIAYFAGCIASYKEKNIKEATLSIFEKLNIDVTILDAICCGNPLEHIGKENKSIKKIENELKKKEIKKIIFSCPNCMKSFAPLSEKYEIMHITQFLLNIPKIKPFGKKMIYHDSSILARYLGIYDEPRILLQKAGKFLEFDENKEIAKCCGSDLAFSTAFPEMAEKMAEKIVEEARKKNAVIVTASPHCYSHLKKYGEVMDIAEVIKKCLNSG